VKGLIQINSQIGLLALQVEVRFSDEIVVLSGENGAGKTTLLRCLAGLEHAQGELIVDDRVWLDSAAGFVLPTQTRDIGCLWPDAALLPWLTVEKNILLGIDCVDEAWVNRLLEKFEIFALMQRKPEMLSTGEAQRVALVRALCRKPSLLLLDEPFSAQAPAIRQRLRVALKAVQEALKIPVIMISHDVEDAEFLAGQHWRMREGRLLAEVESISMNRKMQS